MPGLEKTLESKAGVQTHAAPTHPLVALVGSPNCGKTTLFNALTGSKCKTVNYPGATVDLEMGCMKSDQGEIRVLDLPGIASLNTQSEDEEVTLRVLTGDSPHGAPNICVAIVDATQLERHLYIVRQLQDAGSSVVVAVTMVDLLEDRKGMTFDPRPVRRALDCPVIRVDGRTGRGLPELRREIARQATKAIPHRAAPAPILKPEEMFDRYRALKRLALQCLKSKTTQTEDEILRSMTLPDRLTARLDHVLLHPVWGIFFFTAIMICIFTSVFWMASPLMDLIDQGFSFLAEMTAAILPASWWTSLLTEGIILGVGAVAVFIPQIMILFLAMGTLEDSGYLSRGAMIVDRPLAAVGLSGRGFVPLLSGFACSIPGMMAARTIGNRKERLLTLFIMPMALCSARLPVYGLLLAFLTDSAWKAGLGLTGLYLFSVVSGLMVSAVAGRFMHLKPVRHSSLMLEMPAIRMPKWRVVSLSTYMRTKAYISKAGLTILLIAIVMWSLTHLPYQPEAEAQEQLSNSAAATLGHWIEPVMQPLGMDWRVGAAMISGFAAREVFVSTMALMLRVGGEEETLQEQMVLSMRHATMADGTPIFTTASTLGLIVFFIFALQCFPTVVVSRKESGSWRFALLQLFLLTGFAYLAAVATVQGLRFFGIQ